MPQNNTYRGRTSKISLKSEIVASNIAEGRSFTVNAIAVGVNTALVSLQRYNRARMVQRVNEELADGNGFRSFYHNWLGIDARAVENYKETLEVPTPVDVSMDFPDIEPIPLRPTVPRNLLKTRKLDLL